MDLYRYPGWVTAFTALLQDRWFLSFGYTFSTTTLDCCAHSFTDLMMNHCSLSLCGLWEGICFIVQSGIHWTCNFSMQRTVQWSDSAVRQSLDLFSACACAIHLVFILSTDLSSLASAGLSWFFFTEDIMFFGVLDVRLLLVIYYSSSCSASTSKPEGT